MKQYRTYFSPRGIPLLYIGEPCEVPVVTLENYTKWYEIFLVMPDGSVQAVPSNIVSNIDDPKVGLLWVGHHFHPRLLYRLADYYNGCTDERAVETAAGRWMIEHLDSDEYHFVNPALYS
jgi:hypothetical protein